MTITMTATTFNKERSHAARAARNGEDVVITSASGDMKDALILTRLDKHWSPIAIGLANGSIIPPRKPSSSPFLPPSTNPDRAREALEQFELERAL